MLTLARSRLLFIAAAELAAVIMGVGAAFAINLPSAPPASASQNCTHYSPAYFVGDPASQPHLCYAYEYLATSGWKTSSWAARDSNVLSFRDIAQN
jgi:hypothetical protein